MISLLKKADLLVKTTFIAVCIVLLAFFKISFVVGSHRAFFSAANFLTPLMGVFCGALVSGLFFVSRMFWHLCMYKTISLSFLAFYIPGLCASLYLATRSSIIRFFLPALCMMLFIVHPIGSTAFVYSFYWFIPMILYCVPHRSFFFHALGSTFVAHAVGSVLWLYTVPTTAYLWLGLIPIVAMERLCFAMGMTVVYYGASFVGAFLRRLSQQLIASYSAYAATSMCDTQ